MSDEKVIVGRDRYLSENRLGLASYTAKKFPVYFFRWAVWLPNPGFLPAHDLHHVITGYRTGLVGEAEISAYELRGGCGSIMIFILCVGAIVFGMFVAPKRIWRAWKQSRGTRNLYHSKISYETLLDMKVGDLRQELGLPRSGLACEAGASIKPGGRWCLNLTIFSAYLCDALRLRGKRIARTNNRGVRREPRR